MKKLAKVAFAFMLVAVGTAATERSARADIPPPNMTCGNKKAGDACVDDDKKSGTCNATKCSRMGMTPGPNGTMERAAIEYDCMLCVAGSSAPATSGTPSSPSEKKGCNTAGSPVDTGDASLFALGVLGLVAWRRKSRARAAA